jgi:hypothetical protein
LTYRWTHREPEIDRLHTEVVAEIGSRLTARRRELFDAIARRAHERAGWYVRRSRLFPPAPRFPYLNELGTVEPNPIGAGGSGLVGAQRRAESKGREG